MKTSLKWALGLSTCASAVSMLWPASAPDVELTSPPSKATHSTGSTRPIEVPTTLPMQVLLATKLDPFATVQKPLPVVAPVPALVVPPPPTPVAPPLGYRYVGSFTGPDGSREVYLSRADRVVSVKPGSQLESGYVVESINATAVKVLHAGTQTKVDIPIAQNKNFP